VNSYRVFSVVVAAASLAACATPDSQQSSAQSAPQSTSSYHEKVYTTGSRIPVKEDGGGSASVKSVDNKQGIDDAMQNRNIYIPPAGGPR
jgi:hypothetical protein